MLTYPAFDGSPLGQFFPASTSPAPGGGSTIAVAAGQPASLGAAADASCCAAGDFAGAGQDSVAVLAASTGALTLALFAVGATGPLLAPAATASVTSEPVGATLGLATGRFDPSSTPETDRLAIAYALGDALHLEVWDATDTPSRIASGAAPLPLGDFALAAADVNGDGIDELALFWNGPADEEQNTLFLTLYAMGNASGATGLSQLASAGIAAAAAPSALALAAGSCTAPGSDQIVLAWIEGASTLAVACAYDPSSAAIDTGQPYQPADYPAGSPGLLRVAAGDLNDDGVDEFVLGSQGSYTASDKTTSDSLLVLRLLELDGASLAITAKSTGLFGAGPGQGLLASALDLRVGAVAGLPAESLVVACVGSDTYATTLEGEVMLTVGVLPIGDGAFPGSPAAGPVALPYAVSLDVVAPAQSQAPFAANLVLGTLSGTKIRVGPPQVFQVKDTTGIVAIINGPPVESALVSTVLGGGQLNFAQTDGSTTSLSLQYTRDWMLSDTLGGHGSLSSLGTTVSRSLNKTYGQNMSNGTTKLNTITAGIGANITPQNLDDYLLLTTTDYAFWEYPVLDDANPDAAAGHVLIVWPDPETCNAPTQTALSALDSYYNPLHVPGILMSYPSPATPPPGYLASNELYSGSLDTAKSQPMVQINSNTMTTDQSATTRRIALNVNTSVGETSHMPFLGGLMLGANLATMDSYSQSTMSTHTVSFQQSTNISVSYQSVTDANYQYTVNVFLYWSDPDGYLVLDYQVGVEQQTFWAESFAQAMPTFGLPWVGSSGQIAALSRDIDPECQPDSRAPGALCNCTKALVTATVRNLGLTASDQLILTFYQGDPAEPGSTQIGQQTLQGVPARGTAPVAVDWTPPDPNQPYAVYCRLQGAPGNRPFVPIDAYNMYPSCYWSTAE